MNTSLNGLLQNLREPNACFRPIPFWSWNDKLNLTELKRQIDEFYRQGFGGFFIHARVGLVTGYLSEEWMRLVKECASYAKGYGLQVWLYDEDMWPSGYAGGMVPAVSRAHRGRALALTAEKDILPDDRVLRKFCRGGKRYAAAVRVLPYGNPRFNGTCYIDTLNPAVVADFLSCTHERYNALFSGCLSDYVAGVFTDEPCFILRSCYDMPAVPFTDDLASAFASKYGYSLEERVEALFFDIVGAEQVRYDYYRLITERFALSFTAQYAAWCRAHSIRFTGHMMGEESLQSQIEWIGAAMPHYKYFDYPGVDKIFRGLNELVQYKQVSSVAEQLGKERALSECFAGLGQDCGFEERRKIVNYQAVCGITLLNPHLALYSMRGERKRDYPPNLFYQQPYWEEEHRFSEYTARISEIAAYGERVSPVLVLHPVSGAWAKYVPGETRLSALDCELHSLSEALMAARIEFHYGDELLLEEYARVENGAITVGKYRYEVAIITSAPVYSEKLVKLLQSASCLYTSDLKRFPNGVYWRNAAALTAQLRCALPRRFSVTDEKGREMPQIWSSLKGTANALCAILFNNSEQAARVRCKSEYACCAEADLAGGNVRAQDGTLELMPGEARALLFTEKPIPNLSARKGKCRLEKYVYPARVLLRDKNVLPIDRADCYVSGKRAAKAEHLSKIWHNVFYPLKEGTPFAAEYHFISELQEAGNLFAVIENAENLDCITLNGRPLRAARERGEIQTLNETCWKDPAFTRVPLNQAVRRGENVLRIEGKKYNNISGVGTHRRVEQFDRYCATELENIFVVGNFSLVQRGKSYALSAAHEIAGQNVLADGIPFYAGALIAEFSLTVPKGGAWLCIDGAETASMSLYIDGIKADSAVLAPFRFNLTAYQGKRVAVALQYCNTLFPAFGPNYLRGYDKLRWVDPFGAADETLYAKTRTVKPFSIGKITVQSWE